MEREQVVDLKKGIHVHVWDNKNTNEPVFEVDAKYTDTYDDHYQVCFQFEGRHFEMRVFKKESAA